MYGPSLFDNQRYAELRYWFNSNSKYNILLKAPPVLVRSALGDVSQDKDSTWLHLMLYLSLDTPLMLYFLYTLTAVL